MSRPDAGGRGAGRRPATVLTARPTQPVEGSQPSRRLQFLGAWAGIIGPLLLAVYFAFPAMVHLPAASASPGTLIAFANAHRLLFYLGGWLQVTGALLSILFFLLLLQLSGARRTLAGSATLVGCAVLLSVVAIEAVLLEEVNLAAANGDHATVATAFALGTGGVFARIFPLAAAPLVFGGIGFALSGTSVLPRFFAQSAVVIAGLFLVAGFTAVFGTAGLVFAIVMSIAEAVWILAAAIAFAWTRGRNPVAPAAGSRGYG